MNAEAETKPGLMSRIDLRILARFWRSPCFWCSARFQTRTF